MGSAAGLPASGGTGFQGFSQSLSQVLDDHSSEVKQRIAAEALQVASSRGGAQVSVEDLARAIGTIQGTVPIGKKMSRIAIFFSWFSPFTCVCTVLCIVFAYLALKPVAGGTPAAFLDVAKIFAGAIVGSTTSTAISKSREG